MFTRTILSPMSAISKPVLMAHEMGRVLLLPPDHKPGHNGLLGNHIMVKSGWVRAMRFGHPGHPAKAGDAD